MSIVPDFSAKIQGFLVDKIKESIVNQKEEYKKQVHEFLENWDTPIPDEIEGPIDDYIEKEICLGIDYICSKLSE